MAAIAATKNAGSRALAAAILVLVAIGSVRADTVASVCPHNYPSATIDATQPIINLGQLKQQLYFYACSGAYDQDLAKVLADATAYVEKRAGEVSRPALVLDVDETALSNMPNAIANDFGYIREGPCDNLPKGPCGFIAWSLSPRARAIPGALALFNAAKARNVAVFFITGRRDSDALREGTAKNLEAAGYRGWDGLVLRPLSAAGQSIVAYKSGARSKIAEQRYTIIANVGDQQTDLDGGYAERAYKLPNPFYHLP